MAKDLIEIGIKEIMEKAYRQHIVIWSSPDKTDS